MNFKNINVDGIARMVGSNWVATPFALNFGYKDHGYDSDYIYAEYLKGDIIETNLFGSTRQKYKDWRYRI